jgi:hypothetical protein
MSFEGLNDDIEINDTVELTFSVTQLAYLVRAQLLKDSRRMGNLYGHVAQKRTPLASKPQNPGTQRVW